ncbi:MAG: HDIG domain-containing protein [Nanoarchaeota archaeon]|nr:HDIG domain-containing protein [Nanoarchaeota archaeon]
MFKLELYERIGVIQSKSLVKTVTEILNAADEGFWLDPCSVTGKYHPAEDQGNQGLIRHLVKATYVFEQEARRLMFEDYERDAGMAATILHDIKKNGEKWGKDTDYMHGITGANFIKQFKFSDKTIKKMVMNAVRYHMAPWNTSITKEKMKQARENPEANSFSYTELMKELDERTRGLFPSRIEKAVQDSDYWSSRESMSFYPGKTIMPDVNKMENLRKHDSPEEWVQDILGFNCLMSYYRRKEI